MIVARSRVPLVCLFLTSLLAATAGAQTYEVAGTRAAGMGGAFVAVADDASAAYWNPAGLASGSYFSLVLNHTSAKAHDPTEQASGSQTSTFLGLAMPALGLTYYRLRGTQVEDLSSPAELLAGTPVLGGPASRVSSLITHHAGVTLVQSLTDWLAVGTTLKLVRGIAASGLVPARDREELLDEGGGLVGRAETKFDADIGMMATYRTLKVGLSTRNVGDHHFDIPDRSTALRLQRQVRLGAALVGSRGLLVSADLDLQKVPGTTGTVRNFATGAEARLTPRAWVRGGFRVNTLDDQPQGRTPVATGGATYAAFGSLLVEGHVAWGAERADRGWGLGARVVF